MTSLALDDALVWAERAHDEVMRAGGPLSERGKTLAATVGVEHPEKIRLFIVDTLPRVFDWAYCGLTLGYAVMMQRGHDSNPYLLSAQFRFVQQFERVGSLRDFVAQYLRDIEQHGHQHAPMNLDAIFHSISDCTSEPAH